MVIRFTRDFRSAATNEVFYSKGQTADLERGNEVVAEGAAEAVPLKAREGQVEPTKGEDEPIPPRVSSTESEEETDDKPARGRPRKQAT